MMKKWIALALAAMMALSVLTACGGSEDEKEPAEPDVVTETGEDENTIETVPGDGENEAEPETPETPDEQPAEPEETEQPAEPSDEEIPEAPAPEEPSDVPASGDNSGNSGNTSGNSGNTATGGNNSGSTGNSGSSEPAPVEPSEPAEPAEPTGDETPAEPELAEIIEAIYAVKPSGLGSLMTTELDLTDADMLAYCTGLTDASKLAEACISEPMIGSQAYSLILARVNDPADAESVAREIMANINPAKWICVCAGDMSAAVSGDLVLFVMIDENFEDKNASDFTDAFISLYGGSTVAK